LIRRLPERMTVVPHWACSQFDTIHTKVTGSK
jgi:hypothetical protein